MKPAFPVPPAPLPEGVDPFGSAHPGREYPLPIRLNLGIDRSRAPHLIADGAWRMGSNVYFPRGSEFPRTRPGLVQYMLGDAADNAIKTVYVYQANATTQYTVFAALNAGGTDMDLYYLDPVSKEKVALATNLGSTTPPVFATFQGYLFIAVTGQALRVWCGYTSGSPTRERWTITVNTQPANGETVTIGGRVFTFKTTWSQAFDVQIGGTVNATAANLGAEIARGSWDVTQSVNTNVVTVTAVLTGAAGNFAVTDGTGGNLILANTVAPVNGPQLDSITTYGAPYPSMLATTHNGYLVASGDSRAGYEDRVNFCANTNGLHWMDPTDGYGDAWWIDLGRGEGNKPSALASRYGEVWVHKTGQNKAIHRLVVQDPRPETFTVLPHFFDQTAAAMNPRCALTAGMRHLTYDDGFFRTFMGSDLYDEVATMQDGLKMYDLLRDTSAVGAFMVTNPRELYTLVFPDAGARCGVYHYADARWSYFNFEARLLHCACYAEALDTVLFGADDGYIYKFDPTVATDDGVEFASHIRGRTYNADSLHRMLLKGVIIDYENVISGTGRLEWVVDGVDDDLALQTEFTLRDSGLLLADATMLLYDADFAFADAAYSRVSSKAQVQGKTLAPQFTLYSGAWVLNNAVVPAASWGRS